MAPEKDQNTDINDKLDSIAPITIKKLDSVSMPEALRGVTNAGIKTPVINKESENQKNERDKKKEKISNEKNQEKQNNTIEKFQKSLETAISQDTKNNETKESKKVLNKYGQKTLDLLLKNFNNQKDNIDEDKIKLIKKNIEKLEAAINTTKNTNPDGDKPITLDISAYKDAVTKREIELHLVNIQNRINKTLENTQSTEQLKSGFFDGGSESDFNEVFDYVKNSKNNKDKEKFQNIIKKYIQAENKATTLKETPNITDIKLETATKESPLYIEGTRIITYKIGTETKIITRGPLDKLQERKADKQKDNLPKEIFGNNLEGTTLEGLNTFDGIGNYQSFKNFIEGNGSDYVNNNLENIINGIKTYKPKEKTSDSLDYQNNISELKNNYSTTLTDFIIAKGDNKLRNSYIKQVKPGNITMFGIDKETQTKNFDKLVKTDKFQKIQKTLDKTNLDQIMNTKLSIQGTNPEDFTKSLKEGFKNGFKGIVESFGGLMLNIIEFLGGKGAVKKFCSNFGINYEEYLGDIEKIYNEKYQLSTNQTGLLKEINESKKNRVGTDEMIDRMGNKTIKYSKANIKSTYVEKFSDSKNFQELDPLLIEEYLRTSNIKHQENIIIKEKQSDGKIIKKINPDIDNLTTKPERISILTDMITEGTRQEVQETGNKISRSNLVYNEDIKTEGMNDLMKDKANNEINKAKDMKKAKGLSDTNDIGMCLGVYLMKGSGDLKYSISQTDGIPTPIIKTDVLPQNSIENKAVITPDINSNSTQK